MHYLLDWHVIAAAVLRVLPTHRNLIVGLPLDTDTLIPEVTMYSMHMYIV